ncbi:MAG TPA: hypothetical protein VI300_12765 [Solirubrobacter sp.]
MRRLVIAAAALLACTGTAAEAQAATLVNSGGRLTYTAGGSAPVSVSFSYGGAYALSVIPQDANRDPVTVTGCTTVTASFVYYECSGVSAVAFTGGSGDDTVWGSQLSVPLVADGGAGNDQLEGGSGADSLSGGAGDDYLKGETGDTVGGGPGVDYAYYAAPGTNMIPGPQVGPVNLTLDEIADDGVAGDRVNFLADVEDVDADERFTDDAYPLTTYGPVTMTGTDAGNHLTGSSGADTITGGGGIDVLDGMAGDDTLLARDGLADRVRCGEGTDTAIVDAFDQVSDTCETVLVSGRAAVDDTPPRIAWRPGSALGIAAEDDQGIATVQWLDDDRVICTVTAAPFDCDYRPRIEDVGANTITAVATDTAGQTASITTTRTVARLKPIAVSLRVKRSGRRYVATGKVTLPAGIPCSGTVAVGKRTAKLTRTCGFRIVVPRSTKYVAAYLGTEAIAPQRSKAVRARG